MTWYYLTDPQTWRRIEAPEWMAWDEVVQRNQWLMRQRSRWRWMRVDEKDEVARVWT